MPTKQLAQNLFLDDGIHRLLLLQWHFLKSKENMVGSHIQKLWTWVLSDLRDQSESTRVVPCSVDVS